MNNPDTVREDRPQWPACFSPRAFTETLAVGGLAAVAVVAGSAFSPWVELDYLAGAVMVIGAVFAAFFVVGPSRFAITFFLSCMLLGHDFLSPVVVGLGGVEWHPREFLLFLLLAHVAVQFMTARANLHLDVIHYFYFLYVAFFAYTAALGVLRNPDLHAVVSECRYPLFLAAFLALCFCVHSTSDIRYYSRLILILALGIAAAGSAFFCYTLITGNVINVQNILGAYVRREIGPFLLQSVRPNGLLYFEVCIVTLTSLLFCRELSTKVRAFFLACILLFSFAVLITMMRTAYIALFLALGVLAILSLPRDFRLLAWYAGGVVAIVGAILFGSAVLGWMGDQIPALGDSLRGRFVEMRGGFRVFQQHPITGAGMGSRFTEMGYVSSRTLLSVSQQEYQSVHNVWLYYLFKGGMIGALLVGVGLGGIAVRGHAFMNAAESHWDRCFLRGLLASYIGHLIASTAMPRLTYPTGGVFLALIAGAFAVYAADQRQAPSPESAGDLRS